ncbi:hypothetical protein PR048_030627 [Dryococelus australis]|uniref:Uncharacterized protein n=1 Tax=Dryococelus australis TaxID=614101 RepID=A0ABQ9GC20_9NEOP|nr:hypothetical protein PR048_030627 [Dryococelus australis]
MGSHISSLFIYNLYRNGVQLARKGVQLANADALSHLPTSRDLGEVLFVGRNKVGLNWYQKQAWPYFRTTEELFSMNNCLTLGNRVVVPRVLRRDVLDL